MSQKPSSLQTEKSSPLYRYLLHVSADAFGRFEMDLLDEHFSFKYCLKVALPKFSAEIWEDHIKKPGCLSSVTRSVYG